MLKQVQHDVVDIFPASMRRLPQQLPRHRVRARQPAIDRNRLPVHIARLIGGEEQRDVRQFFWPVPARFSGFSCPTLCITSFERA
jgi:hypothetical protein